MDAIKNHDFKTSTTKGRIQEIQNLANQFMPQRGGNGGGGGGNNPPNSGGSGNKTSSN